MNRKRYQAACAVIRCAVSEDGVGGMLLAVGHQPQAIADAFWIGSEIDIATPLVTEPEPKKDDTPVMNPTLQDVIETIKTQFRSQSAFIEFMPGIPVNSDRVIRNIARNVMQLYVKDEEMQVSLRIPPDLSAANHIQLADRLERLLAEYGGCVEMETE